MTGRRELLRNALRFGGLGLALAIGGGYWLGRERLARWRVGRALRERVAPVEIPDVVMDAFLADVAHHDPRLAARLDEDTTIELLAGRLLLSTDFFARGAAASGELTYLRYANVYVNACVNPFARLVEVEPAGVDVDVDASVLFATRCASCHEGEGAPSLDGVAERLGDELGEVVREGRGLMPAARSLGLDESAIEELVAWLRAR